MRKKKENKIYYYTVEYASGILRINSRDSIIITSNKELKEDAFVVVEHIGCGVFIGRVYKEFCQEDCIPSSAKEYRYLKDINLSDWVEEIERKKRMEELQKKMESKFAEIDKKKKFEYYAQIDDDFRELYLEYEDLGGKGNETD